MINKNVHTDIITEDALYKQKEGINKIIVTALTDDIFIEGTAKYKGKNSIPIPLPKGKDYIYNTQDNIGSFWVRIGVGASASVMIEF